MQLMNATARNAIARRVIPDERDPGRRADDARPRVEPKSGRRDYVEGFANCASGKEGVMKTATALLAAAFALALVSPADAKGCIKGAIVGGVAGHYTVHHGWLGAAAGCLYGRHRAKQQERQREMQSSPREQPQNQTGGRM